MTVQGLVNALYHLKVETGSFACMGCGYEHNCSIHGCAIVRKAADAIAALTEKNARLRATMKPNCIGCEWMHPDNGNCTIVGGFCTAVPAAHCPLIPKLRAELEQVKREWDAAVSCIYEIEDDLDRGNDNDWAREHIEEWRSTQKEE